MSITNYFGKPRTKYVPYKSPYTFDHLPNIKCDKANGSASSSCGRIVYNSEQTYFDPTIGTVKSASYIFENEKKDAILFNLSKFATIKSTFIPVNELTDRTSGGYGFAVRYSVCDRFPLCNINIMFTKFLQEIIEWIEHPIWELVKFVPVVNMSQVLILKIADTDKHVEHLEKMFASVCEDNTLLNNRIKALEQRLERQTHIPVAEPIDEHITVAEAVLKC